MVEEMEAAAVVTGVVVEVEMAAEDAERLQERHVGGNEEWVFCIGWR